MGFWQWAGQFAIAGLTCGMGIFLLRWWKEVHDRKARKHSYHAKCLLEEADRICGFARALLEFSKNTIGNANYRKQASILWKTSSVSSLLNVWLANAWVLDKRRKLKKTKLRTRFEGAVEQLRLVAVQWNDAHTKLVCEKPQSDKINTSLLTGFRKWPSQDDFDEIYAPVTETFEVFLREFQALHNALQPMVQEYMSRSENQQECS
ncbi:MAG: hypothetical protein KAR11_04160 [Phycisphaerae bacterium]|nr:hypothetical protein [Phycisphaerae bacterium]